MRIDVKVRKQEKLLKRCECVNGYTKVGPLTLKTIVMTYFGGWLFVYHQNIKDLDNGGSI